MPAKKAVKTTKRKLSPAERSQIAKDRWAKRKAPKIEVDWEGAAEAVASGFSGEPINQEPFRPEPPTPYEAAQPFTPPPQEPTAPPPPDYSPAPLPAPVFVGAPQLAPAAPKKVKRYQGPKEFSVALKAAESRLAKAINERAEAMGKLAGLNAEIPSLMGIIQALKGSSVQIPPVPYDFSGAGAFQIPAAPQFQAPTNPLAAFQAAQVAPPVSRAQGGAMQFGPEVIGALEGPEDDDIDRFITGPAAGGSGWVGG